MLSSIGGVGSFLVCQGQRGLVDLCVCLGGFNGR